MGYKEWDDEDLDWAYIKGVITGIFIGSLAWFLVGVYL